MNLDKLAESVGLKKGTVLKMIPWLAGLGHAEQVPCVGRGGKRWEFNGRAVSAILNRPEKRGRKKKDQSKIKSQTETPK